ncbi:type IV conjugative transfer system lipoprotein TraV [Glaesserella parasuis]|uniref:type IV conjugative transfer system lipoprotein TraV n=1 Tax=Glaesserella parasuis TaxID=738 RepID=UPI00193AFD63|nr:type IV conjugative transfer system lipoprotein TraV [Glaesserella parasuis]MDG6337452.1 type IV conjugative transfer system lipoprotein TraV [Glaesserella parasuis]MDG6350744.1 type IV conjugative transfer system lipoprotein TraV [Glaesserella parasuis]MDG6471821.1 type IV conjugative transfer system lipoprotein TraV [Glaesserella parasuis]MDO9743266.1 type IV conjugative transfer system lipoprotein TraV [Glaesserella parasuis]MDO9756284.1 type IV conjugative transfer system lipoprotein Tr
MKKIFMIVCSTSILTGCAGMNSEFGHSEPAKDSGYWMQQADEMTGTAHGKGGNVLAGASTYTDIKQYKLIDTGNLRLPVKIHYKVENVVATRNWTVTTVTKERKIVGNVIQQNDVTPPLVESMCLEKYCYPEPNNPYRNNDKVSRVWLAPYVSPDNNVHLGEIVYFISRKSDWTGLEESK